MVLLLGIFVGWCAAEVFSTAVVDVGLATLVGSALGAAIAVFGTMRVDYKPPEPVIRFATLSRLVEIR